MSIELDKTLQLLKAVINVWPVKTKDKRKRKNFLA